MCWFLPQRPRHPLCKLHLSLRTVDTHSQSSPLPLAEQLTLPCLKGCCVFALSADCLFSQWLFSQFVLGSQSPSLPRSHFLCFSVLSSFPLSLCLFLALCSLSSFPPSIPHPKPCLSVNLCLSLHISLSFPLTHRVQATVLWMYSACRVWRTRASRGADRSRPRTCTTPCTQTHRTTESWPRPGKSSA